MSASTPTHFGYRSLGWKAQPGRGPSDSAILSGWRAGESTADMAARFFWPEADIANRLPHILDCARKGWAA